MIFFRRLIKYIYKLKIINLILNLPFIIVEFLIKKKLVFIPMSIKNRMSMYIESTEFLLRKNENDKLKLIFLNPNKNTKPPNSYLYKILKEKAIVFEYSNQLTKFILFVFVNIIERISINRLYIYNLHNAFLNVQKPHIKFNKNELNFGEKFLKKNKLNSNLIIFNLRESIYYEKNTNQNLPGVETTHLFYYRNPKINNYLKTFKYLNDLNYNIIKTGVKNKQISEFNYDDLYFDYANSNEKNDFTDIYLHYKSSFSIVGCSGSWAYSHLFNKPIIMTNDYAGPFTATFEHDIFIPALYYDYNKEKLLSFNEYCNLRMKYKTLLDSNEMKKLNIKIVHNSDDEILNATKEMIRFINNEDIYDTETYKLRNEFFKIKEINKNFYFFEKCNGNISPYFLKKYSHLL